MEEQRNWTELTDCRAVEVVTHHSNFSRRRTGIHRDIHYIHTCMYANEMGQRAKKLQAMQISKLWFAAFCGALSLLD